MDEKEYRCPRCNKLLLRGIIVKASLKCPRCKELVEFSDGKR